MSYTRAAAAICVLAWAAGCSDAAPRAPAFDGEELYEFWCARCHGKDGRGGRSIMRQLPTPDMSSPEWQGTATPERLKLQIRAGSKNMPPFPAETLDEKQLDAVVAYVRTLGR